MTTPDVLNAEVEVLAFDLYDTLLDRESTLTDELATLLDAKGTDADPKLLLRRYLAMHFRDSLIDSLLPTPHTPFKEVSRRALRYRLDQLGVTYDDADVGAVIDGWKRLDPYPDVAGPLARLGEEFTLVGLSNGDPDMLAAVRDSFDVPLDGVVSVAEAGAYKPHPAPYEYLFDRFDVAPHQVGFVTAHTFDLVGARATGARGLYLNRHDRPFGGWELRPNLRVDDVDSLAAQLRRE